MSKARVRLAIFVGLVLAFVGFAILTHVATGPNDPVVAGKRLSEHLLATQFYGAFPLGTGFDAQAKLGREAIQESGTNSLPLISAWLRSETPLWKCRVGQWLARAGVLWAEFPLVEKRLLALNALALHLRGKAAPLIPVLADCCTNSNSKFVREAAATLSTIVSDLDKIEPGIAIESVPRIERAIASLESQSKGAGRLPSQSLLESALQMIDPRREIRLVLELNGNDDQKRQSAMRVLSRRGVHFDKVRPHLAAHLRAKDVSSVENAIASACNYGAAAASLVPDLRPLDSHPDEKIRLLASNALSRIGRFKP